MIEEKDLAAVGSFQKAHGLKGELNAILDIDYDYFDEGYPLIINIEGAYVPFYAETVRGKGSMACLIKIEGIDGPEEAGELVNATIYAEKSSLKEYMGDEGEELLSEDDLVGFKVIDEEFGEIGSVLHVDDTTENVLLVVSTEDDSELFIPASDEFITGVDDATGVIYTALPEALINLNKN